MANATIVRAPQKRKSRELTGQRFSRLAVLKKDLSRGIKPIYWLCLCDCGNQTSVTTHKLTSGHTKSCGCYHRAMASERRRIHGLSHNGSTPEYGVWTKMRQRCLNPNDRAYKYYGGRGITICDRWKDFKSFIDDMGPRPDGHSIERLDNDGPYSPSNCKWATRLEQANNKRNVRYMIFNGKNQSVSDWCRELGVKHDAIRQRIHVGWTDPQEIFFGRKKRRARIKR